MIVFIGAIIILGGMGFALFTGRLPRFYWWLLIAGWCIGMIWELGFTFSGMGYPIHPGGAENIGGEDLSDLPTLAILLILMIVSIWDGALFLAGLVLARLAIGSHIERTFSWLALGIMLIWGQVQSLFIESYAITNGMWAYAPAPMNPKLFDYGEAQLTLMPQLVWFAGYFVFYAVVLKFSPKPATTPPLAP